MERLVDLIISNPKTDRLVLRIMVGWLMVLVARHLWIM